MFRDAPAFVDMSGQRIAGVHVIDRRANARGNAVWLVRADECGHTFTIEGIKLRWFEKHGRPASCSVCRRQRADERRARRRPLAKGGG